MMDFDDIIRTAEKRVIAMRLASRYGRYTTEQNDMACAYARRAFEFAIRHLDLHCNMCTDIGHFNPSIQFLFRMSNRRMWEE